MSFIFQLYFLDFLAYCCYVVIRLYILLRRFYYDKYKEQYRFIFFPIYLNIFLFAVLRRVAVFRRAISVFPIKFSRGLLIQLGLRHASKPQVFSFINSFPHSGHFIFSYSFNNRFTLSSSFLQ